MKKLSEEIVEEGLATTFVLEVVKDIQQKRNDARKRLIELAASGDGSAGRLGALGGLVVAYEDVLKTINHPTGKDT
jgi:hypothetical protein